MISRASPRVVLAGLVAVVATVPGGGCAHRVRVESNAPDAVVRVDGDPVGTAGTVDDGATFVERWGFGVVYDVDVAAPGYRTERRRLRPSIAEPAVAVPAILGGVGGCVAGGCVLPVAAFSSSEPLGFYAWSGLSVLTLAAAGGACAVGFAASERLPDVVTFNLEREIGAGSDGDLPPPPIDVDAANPLPPDAAPPPLPTPTGTTGATAPTEATSGAGAASLRW